jgi:hypothetical protein
VSDWPLLRAAFDRGTVHVDNTAPAIAEAVRRIRDDRTAYRTAAAKLREQKLTRWQLVRQDIVSRVASLDARTKDVRETRPARA